MHLKNVRIRNLNNVLIQVPRMIINKWNLFEGDALEMHISKDETYIYLKPRKPMDKVESIVDDQ
jgi:hypothetical protein